jgi:hypothetical protein
MHELDDGELKGLIIEETGAADDSNVPSLILTAINSLKKFADFMPPEEATDAGTESREDTTRTIAQIEAAASAHHANSSRVGLNLSYTINLNLPATTDISVFNAIFKSLKENLLQGDNE